MTHLRNILKNRELIDFQVKMIEEAASKNPGHEILPCGKEKDLNSCFTSMNNKTMFWFNTTKSNSTQMICWEFKNVRRFPGVTNYFPEFV